MSAYTTRWCPKHGEWDEDVDNPSECYACLEEGIAPSQLKDAELARLAARVAELEGENKKILEGYTLIVQSTSDMEELRLLREENAKLWACVAAADAFFLAEDAMVNGGEEGAGKDLWVESQEHRDAYDAARAGVDNG